jgi:chromosomal replication initiation ATPase DnaA
MELTAAEVWSRILERARSQLPEQTYRIWLVQTEPVTLTEDHLVVATSDTFSAGWIGDKYGDLLMEVALRIFGRRLKITFQQAGRASAAVMDTPAHAPLPQAPLSQPPPAPVPLPRPGRQDAEYDTA